MAKKKAVKKKLKKSTKKTTKKGVKKLRRAAKKAARVINKVKKNKAKGAVKTKAEIKEKVLGKVDHFFDKISVAAVKVAAPFKVGDILHIKGHTTNFTERLESMQINHHDVQQVKKGDDVGIKVKDFVREHDIIYLADNQKEVVQPLTVSLAKTEPASLPVKSAPMFQTSIFKTDKPISAPAAKPMPNPAPNRPVAKKADKIDPYSNTKFFNF